jgi:hypothetical protein
MNQLHVLVQERWRVAQFSQVCNVEPASRNIRIAERPDPTTRVQDVDNETVTA